MISSVRDNLDRSATLPVSLSLVARCRDWARSFQIQQQQQGIHQAYKNLLRRSDRQARGGWLPVGVRQWNRWRAKHPHLAVDLQGVDLRGANLSGANLSQASLRGAQLDGALLAGANLCGADLRDASLNRADLQGALIADADLSGAILWWANLRGAIVSPASLETAHLQNATPLA